MTNEYKLDRRWENNIFFFSFSQFPVRPTSAGMAGSWPLYGAEYPAMGCDKGHSHDRTPALAFMTQYKSNATQHNTIQHNTKGRTMTPCLSDIFSSEQVSSYWSAVISTDIQPLHWCTEYHFHCLSSLALELPHLIYKSFIKTSFRYDWSRKKDLISFWKRCKTWLKPTSAVSDHFCLIYNSPKNLKWWHYSWNIWTFQRLIIYSWL